MRLDPIWIWLIVLALAGVLLAWALRGIEAAKQTALDSIPGYTLYQWWADWWANDDE